MNVTKLIDTAVKSVAAEPLELHWTRGKSKLVLVLGPNASGKSLFRRIASAVCHHQKPSIEFIGLSMEGRHNIGPWGCFVYGSEADDATGVNSAKTVTTGIETAKDRKTPHVLFWDEPDLGLSEEYQLAVGAKIREFIEAAPEHTVAAFVVTHSRCMVNELLKAKPHVVMTGGFTSVETWLTRLIEPGDLNKLYEKNLETWRRVNAVLKG